MIFHMRVVIIIFVVVLTLTSEFVFQHVLLAVFFEIFRIDFEHWVLRELLPYFTIIEGLIMITHQLLHVSLDLSINQYILTHLHSFFNTLPILLFINNTLSIISATLKSPFRSASPINLTELFLGKYFSDAWSINF